MGKPGGDSDRLETKTKRLIGRRLQEARLLRGFTLVQLAEETGFKYQSIQKYEKGENVLTAVRLMVFAKTLRLPIGFFYDEKTTKAEKDDKRLPNLRVARKLARIEKLHPEAYPALCEMLNAMARTK
jgi:transcriptional regulator with XRE-family HTH domain